MAQMQNDKIESEAIAICREFKSINETGTTFVTERVAFRMREMIRQFRKNYWGVFDEPIDPNTGREKIWQHLTKTFVNATVKNIDLDTKDINFRARNPESIPFIPLVNQKLHNELERDGFGEALDALERDLAIDGTAIWKTWKQKGKIFRRRVDLLNFYIDGTVDRINAIGGERGAEAVMERAALQPQEVESMDWLNNKEIKGSKQLSRTDGENFAFGNNQTSVKLIDVYEYWGVMPLSLITGKDDDKEEMIEGHIIVSGLNTGDARLHLIEKNLKKDEFGNSLKPYEEAWYRKVPGRWYGEGIAEELMWHQLWLNIITNIRITRSYVSQLGLFKIKKGTGITAEMLSKLAANGAIAVNSMNDIEQMVINEASAASLNDEANIISWSERITSAFESVTGETLPASATATSTAISSRAGQSEFVLVKEGVGMFLSRWLERHVLRDMKIKKNDIVRFAGFQAEDIRDMSIKIANYVTVDRALKENRFDASIITERDGIAQQIIDSGEFFLEAFEDIPLSDFNVTVDITNEKVDKNVLVSNLISTLQIAPEFRDQIIGQLFSALGLTFKPTQTTELPAGSPQSQPQQQKGQLNPNTNVPVETQALQAASTA